MYVGMRGCMHAFVPVYLHAGTCVQGEVGLIITRHDMNVQQVR